MQYIVLKYVIFCPGALIANSQRYAKTASSLAVAEGGDGGDDLVDVVCDG